MRRRAVTLLLLLLLTVSAAQEQSTPQITPSIETRITLLESRLARVEADINRLAGVPTTLARMESQLTALTQRSDGLSGNINHFVQGALLVVVGGIVGAVINSRPKTNEK